jgi:hypothetical protein
MIFSDLLSATRYAAETVNSNGEGVPGAATGFSVRAAVQRPKGVELQKLVEGWGTNDVWYVDTPTQLRTFDEQTGTPPDTLVIDGLSYEVCVVDHLRAVIKHYECVVRRIDTGRS